MNDIEKDLAAALAAEAMVDNPTYDLEAVWSAAAATDQANATRPALGVALVSPAATTQPAVSPSPSPRWFDRWSWSGSGSRPWRRDWLVAVSAVFVLGLGVLAVIQVSDNNSDGTVELDTAPANEAGPSAQPGSSSGLAAGASGSESGSAGAAPSSAPCPSGPGTVPEGASVGGTVDIDGDGLADRAWIRTKADGGTEVGVVTAAGGGAVRDFDSASPVERAILVADTDAQEPVEILASDGRSVELWAFVDCEIVAVTNLQGDTYTFSLGFSGTGTGVGCTRVGGAQHLVGLHVVGDDGTTAEWSRTVVELDGTTASNGATDTGTFTRPDDAEAIELLHQVSCGDATMATDGIFASPPPPPAGCSSGPAVVPEDASSAATIDVDGDGQPDQAWIRNSADGDTEVGIVTSTGGGAAREFVSASPVVRSILVVNADGRGPVEILASDGRSVEVWAFVDCEIVDVTNPQGSTYTFSLGFSGIGTGVGCVPVDGAQHLVGLHIVSDDGTTVEWSRTVVNLDGTTASNGATETGTFTRPDDDAAIELLFAVTCGDATMATHGIFAR